MANDWVQLFDEPIPFASVEKGELQASSPVPAERRDWMLNSVEAQAFFRVQDDGMARVSANRFSSRSMFEQSVWLHQCIHSIAINIARQPFGFTKGRARSPVLKHPILDLIHNPNPYFTELELWYLTVCYLEIQGEAFWFLDRGESGGNTPTQIWIIPPWHVYEVVDKTLWKPYLLGWQATLANGQSRFIQVPDMIQFRYPNPWNMWRGSSPLITAGLATANDIEYARHNLKFVRNGARPAGVLVAKEKLNPVQRQQNLDAWESRHSEPGRPALLDGGIDYHETQISNAEMEFSLGREWNMREIAAAFKVPPIELGKDDASYANAREQVAMFWRSKLIPTGDLLCDPIQKRLLNKGDDTALTAWFDTTNIDALKQDDAMLSTAALNWRNLGIPFRLINERMKLSFPSFAGDDVSLVPYTLTLMDTVISPPDVSTTPGSSSTPPVPGDKPGDTTAKTGDTKSDPTVNTMRSLISGIVMDAIGPEPESESHGSLASLLPVLFKSIDEGTLELMQASERYFMQAVEVGIEQTRALIEVNLSIDEREVVSFINERLSHLRKVSDATKNGIRQILSASHDRKELADGLRELSNWTLKVSGRIAKNSIWACLNGGRYLAMVSEGIETTEWLTAGNEYGRESHASSDGIVTPVESVFPLTGCRYPHDSDGVGPQTLDCQCLSIPRNGNQSLISDSTRLQYWTECVRMSTPIYQSYNKRVRRFFIDERKKCLSLVKG